MKKETKPNLKPKIRSWTLMLIMVLFSGIVNMSCEKEQTEQVEDLFYVDGWIESQNQNVIVSNTLSDRGKGKNSFKKALKKAMQKSDIRRKQIKEFGYIAWDNIELIASQNDVDFLAVPIINEDSKYVEAVIIGYESEDGENVQASFMPREAIAGLSESPVKAGNTTKLDIKTAALITSFLDIKLFGRTTCTLHKIIYGETGNVGEVQTLERAEYCFTEPVEITTDWYNVGGGFGYYSDTTTEWEWVTVCYNVNYGPGSGGSNGGSSGTGTPSDTDINIPKPCNVTQHWVSLTLLHVLGSTTNIWGKETKVVEGKCHAEVRFSQCWPIVETAYMVDDVAWGRNGTLSTDHQILTVWRSPQSHQSQKVEITTRAGYTYETSSNIGISVEGYGFESGNADGSFTRISSDNHEILAGWRQ